MDQVKIDDILDRFSRGETTEQETRLILEEIDMSVELVNKIIDEIKMIQIKKTLS